MSHFHHVLIAAPTYYCFPWRHRADRIHANESQACSAHGTLPLLRCYFLSSRSNKGANDHTELRRGWYVQPGCWWRDLIARHAINHLQESYDKRGRSMAGRRGKMNKMPQLKNADVWNRKKHSAMLNSYSAHSLRQHAHFLLLISSFCISCHHNPGSTFLQDPPPNWLFPPLPFASWALIRWFRTGVCLTQLHPAESPSMISLKNDCLRALPSETTNL